MLQLDLERKMGVCPKQKAQKGTPSGGESLCKGPEVGRVGCTRQLQMFQRLPRRVVRRSLGEVRSAEAS